MQYLGIILLFLLVGLVFLAAWLAGRLPVRETPRAAEEVKPPSPEVPESRDDLPAAAILAAIHVYCSTHSSGRE